MKRILYIIAQENFRDEELLTPKRILEERGAKVIVASITNGECKGMKGAKIVPDITVKEADLGDYDMVVMAGGTGSTKLYDYDEVHNLFLLAREMGKPYGAICIAPMNLAKMGVLQNVKATVYRTDESMDAFSSGGVFYTEARVVIDGNVVTANGPEASEEFGNALCQVLGLEK